VILAPDAINETFRNLDVKQDGLLHFDQVKSFLHGRYNLDGANLQTAFHVHAHIHDKDPSEETMDLAEFQSIW